MLQRLRVPSGVSPEVPGAPPPAIVPLPGQREVAPDAPLAGEAVALGRPTSTELFAWLFGGALAHPSGAIAGWRDRATGRISDEYPEISGYYLSAAVFADATDREPVARCAEWLTERIEASELASRRVDGAAVYNFDLGIISAGLIKYGVRAGHARVVAAGARAAAMLRDQVERHGHLPTFDRRGGRPVGRPATWSTVGRLHLAKTVQCLLLADELGVAGARDAARIIVDDTRLRFSLSSDSLREANGQINLHAACYALEGLWIWDAFHNATRRDEILHTALDEIVSYQLPSGAFPRNASFVAPEQSDVHAQVIRLAVLLGREATVQTSVSRLRQVALLTEGGWAVPYHPQASEIHENAWATMFAAQALALVDHSSQLEWWQLV